MISIWTKIWTISVTSTLRYVTETEFFFGGGGGGWGYLTGLPSFFPFSGVFLANGRLKRHRWGRGGGGYKQSIMFPLLQLYCSGEHTKKAQIESSLLSGPFHQIKLLPFLLGQSCVVSSDPAVSSYLCRKRRGRSLIWHKESCCKWWKPTMLFVSQVYCFFVREFAVIVMVMLTCLVCFAYPVGHVEKNNAVKRRFGPPPSSGCLSKVRSSHCTALFCASLWV